MKIFVTGGTGFVGKSLTKRLAENGHEITVLTRKLKNRNDVSQGITFIEGNPTSEGTWQNDLIKHDVVINLAGAPIMAFWTESKKREIKESRVMTTRNIVTAITQSKNSNIQLLSTSAIGYYGFHKEEILTEESDRGKGFLSDVAEIWEAEALKAADIGARVVLCRFGVIVGEKGGMLDAMLPIFKMNFGGGLGSGKQWVSWIHIQDIINIYEFLLKRQDITGPINCTAPYPVRNKEMAIIVAHVLGKKVYIPNIPGFVIKTMLGEFSSIMLEGQKVLPHKLLNEGFTFQYPHLKESLEDILSHL